MTAKRLILMSHDETCVMADKLQTKLGDPLSKDDLVMGGSVIYRYRGKLYKGEILEVKCELASCIYYFLGHCTMNMHAWTHNIHCSW